MRISAILVICFRSAFVFAEKAMESKISEQESRMKCLSKVNGRSIPGFTGTKEMPFMELPCMDGRVNYCDKLLYKTDIEVCKTKCCATLKTTPVPVPENYEFSSGKVDDGAGKSPTEFVTPESVRKKNSGEKNKSNGRPFRFNKNDSENTLLYVFLVILLMAVIICGIFMIRYKRRNAKLERKIRQPIAQPYDAVETMV